MTTIASPFGPLGLRSRDGVSLSALLFEGHRPEAAPAPPAPPELTRLTEGWLAAYLEGRDAEPPPLDGHGTPWQLAVREVLLTIPRGETISYGEIARRLGRNAGAARAVGGAVGANPLAIIVPCHRVVGASGGLVGFAGGAGRKRLLLALEGSPELVLR